MARRPTSLPGLTFELVKIYADKFPRAARGMKILAGLGAVAAACTIGTFMLPSAEVAQPQLSPLATSSCSDAVEGLWTGYQYQNHTKYRFDVRINRTGPGSNELEGTIVSNWWRGGAASTQAPACARGGEAFIVDMEASGELEGDQLHFGGDDWTMREQTCGEGGTGYAPDNFRGTLSEDGTLHAINDDGFNPRTMVIFRRTACASGD